MQALSLYFNIDPWFYRWETAFSKQPQIDGWARDFRIGLNEFLSFKWSFPCNKIFERGENAFDISTKIVALENRNLGRKDIQRQRSVFIIISWELSNNWLGFEVLIEKIERIWINTDELDTISLSLAYIRSKCFGQVISIDIKKRKWNLSISLETWGFFTDFTIDDDIFDRSFD